MTDVVELRRELHAHPELGFAETRTTALIVEYLNGLGLAPVVLAGGTGVVCDIGSGEPLVALRADLDALPIQDEKSVPYRSTVDGVCHGCGHDAHTAILLAAAAELAGVAAAQREEPAGRVRLVFQPAEEVQPGGALRVLAEGWLDGVSQIYALHCDPRLDTGQVGLRAGAITAACDHIEVVLTGPGGHTARPQLTVDLVQALGQMITQLPVLLAQQVDPQAGLTLVWGAVDSGSAANAIPRTGRLRGTVRLLDGAAWHGIEPIVRQLVEDIATPTGAQVEVHYTRGVPPVLNDEVAVAVQRSAVLAALGVAAVAETPQSMGAEDFAWYLGSAYLGSASDQTAAIGALARLGVRRPGAAAFDLHQGTFDIDEEALAVGVRYTVALAQAALVADLRP
jgi:amidohydrolase